MKATFRAKVFSQAWELVEATGKTFSYFDIEANSFRSFRIENLITIY